MTHYIVEFLKDKSKSKVMALESIFRNQFPVMKTFQSKNICLILGDFHEGNFNLSDSSTNLLLETNIIQNRNIEEDNKNKAHPLQSELNASILFDKNTKKIMINSDPFGLDYYYITALEDRIIVSSHIKYILQLHPVLLNQLDYDATIEYLFSHIIFGTKTLFKKIKLLPYNAIIELAEWEQTPESALSMSLEETRHWFDFQKNYEFSTILKDKAEEVKDLLDKFISSLYEKDSTNVHFFLSGGLDSRLLVSLIKDRNKERSQVLTFDSSHEGLELAKAMKVARMLNLHHHIEIVKPEHIVSNSFQQMWYTEGLSNHAVSTMLQLLLSIPESPIFFVDGFVGDAQFGGEFLKKLSKIVYSETNIVDRMYNIMKFQE